MTRSNLAPLIDELGTLRAQMKALEVREDQLKEQLKELPAGEHLGDKFKLRISEGETDRLDMKAVREHLSRQFVQAHTITTATRTLKATLLIKPEATS